MKAFVITIKGLPISEELASRCIQSANGYGINPEIFDAIPKYEALDVLQKYKLKVNSRFTGVNDKPIEKKERRKLRISELGCSLSHYLLYRKCLELNETIMILEHDAYFIDDIKLDIEFDEFLNIKYMSNIGKKYGGIKHNIISYDNPTLYGTAAYCIKPIAANKLVDKIHCSGINTADNLITKPLINIQNYVENPVIHDAVSHSTIQDNPIINSEYIWTTYTGTVK